MPGGYPAARRRGAMGRRSERIAALGGRIPGSPAAEGTRSGAVSTRAAGHPTCAVGHSHRGRQPKASSMPQKLRAATIAAAGIVMNQPMTMFFATPHRTAFTRFVAPTPMIAEVMT